jgi:uncharacterized protein (TIGR02246 family)
MRLIATAPILLFAIGLCQTTWAGPEDEVHARFEEWIKTYNTNDADRLSQLYDQNARLLATGGSEKPIDGRDAIRAYFAPNFKRGPQSIVFDHDDTTNVFSDVGIETGYYHFNVNDAEGKSVSLPSRYTFIFAKKNGTWVIVHHHSSRVPALTPTSAR